MSNEKLLILQSTSNKKRSNKTNTGLNTKKCLSNYLLQNSFSSLNNQFKTAWKISSLIL